jgi:hypothetical protein
VLYLLSGPFLEYALIDTRTKSHMACFHNILWHLEPLLGNDPELGNCKTAVARQRPLKNSRGMVFSARPVKEQLNCNRGAIFCVQSVPSYKYNKSYSSVRRLQELQLKGASWRGQETCTWRPEGSAALEATTKQRSEYHHWKYWSVCDSDM